MSTDVELQQPKKLGSRSSSSQRLTNSWWDQEVFVMMDTLITRGILCSFFFAIAVTVALAVVEYYLVSNREYQAAQQAFTTQSYNAFQAVSSAFGAAVIYPELMSTLFFSSTYANGTSSVTFPQFLAFSDPVGAYWLPGVLYEVEWVPRITNAQRPAFEAAMTKLYGFNKTIFNFDNNGNPALSSVAATYDPIYYVSPMDNFISGLNLGSDPVEGPAIQTALTTGIPFVRAAFPLRGFSGVPPLGFTMYMPVFYNDTTGKVQLFNSGGGHYIGCILPVFIISNALSAVLAKQTLSGIDVYLFDTTGDAAAPTPLYMGFLSRTNLAPATTVMTSLSGDFVSASSANEFTIFNRRYRVCVVGQGGTFLAQFQTYVPLLIVLLSVFAKLLTSATPIYWFIYIKTCGKEFDDANKA